MPDGSRNYGEKSDKPIRRVEHQFKSGIRHVRSGSRLAEASSLDRCGLGRSHGKFRCRRPEEGIKACDESAGPLISAAQAWPTPPPSFRGSIAHTG